MIDRLTIIGVGLIGGSLALALRHSGYCREIVGTSRRTEHLEEAVRLGVIDRYSTDPAEAVKGADMVLLAVPLGAMGTACAQIREALEPGAIVTDAGSAKQSVVRDVEAVLGQRATFVPGHPIAGTERSGVAAAFPELYEGRRVILTPLPYSDPEAVGQVRRMWEVAGAVVEEMSVAHHDTILAVTSHLPHMLAFSLVGSLGRMGESDEVFRYAAGGFRDFTRIASSDPVMWRDICLANREALLDALEHFREDLDGLTEAIRAGDEARLLDIFARAKAARDRFCH
ncbi:MAG: prephenate dehydrogenase/arogenate dehydrogenase family protein [Gammaproteobacteria bacterium]|jgi:prephenate dehydrogenase